MSNSLRKTMTQHCAFDNKPAKLIELTNDAGMSITLMDIGATWLSCRIPINNATGRAEREVLLGGSTLQDYMQNSSYMGATIGRYANRINKGQFKINGIGYQTSVNQSGNTLHGGQSGFDSQRWIIESQHDNQVRFSLLSIDGDQGFPGNLQVFVTYFLNQNNGVEISYQASTDKATPVNLCNHAYVNLMGEQSKQDCRSHFLEINADHYLPTDKFGIPIYELASVAETSFDFRARKLISEAFLSDQQQLIAKGYDHSFYLKQNRSDSEYAAKLTAADHSVCMKVYTDKPAIQLYTGNYLAGEKNKTGGVYSSYAGVALESQFLPDSPNHPEWNQASCILRPGHKYNYKTSYTFEF